MRISTRSRAPGARPQLSSSSSSPLDKSAVRLSAGARVARSRDNPAGLAPRELLPTVGSTFPQAVHAVAEVRSLSTPAEDGSTGATGDGGNVDSGQIRDESDSGGREPHPALRRLPTRAGRTALDAPSLTVRPERTRWTPLDPNRGDAAGSILADATGDAGSSSARCGGQPGGQAGGRTRLDAVSLLVSSWRSATRASTSQQGLHPQGLHPQGLHQLLDAALSDGAAQRPKLSEITHDFGLPSESRATAAENVMASGSRIQDAELAWKMAAFRRHGPHGQAAARPSTPRHRLPHGVLVLLP